MAVHLTRIYTRTGDDGTTGLSDFSRVAKSDPRVTAYADCDEANAAIGVALTLGALSPDIAQVLGTVQNDLFDAGADLSTPVVADPKYPPLRIEQSYIDALERWCDAYGESLPALDSFILPGGTPGSALLHQARTVVRRAERSAWAMLAIFAGSFTLDAALAVLAIWPRCRRPPICTATRRGWPSRSGATACWRCIPGMRRPNRWRRWPGPMPKG